MLILAASLFFTTPAPLEMPAASAYLVSQGESLRFEDRFSVLDLWTANAVLGRWQDDDGRVFTLAKLDTIAPVLDLGETKTRKAYYANTVSLPAKEKAKTLLCEAAEKLVPFDLPEEPEPPRQEFRGLKNTFYLQGTNDWVVSALFLPEKSKAWYLATWELAEGDGFEACKELFDEEFLEKWRENFAKYVPSEIEEPEKEEPSKKDEGPGEKELLRRDARHAVTNYPSWRAVDSEGFTVLYDAPLTDAFVVSLTNDLTRMRSRYAQVVPAAVDASNSLAVARIYANRDEYLEIAVGREMQWSAAYWCPTRRELVAYLPDEGSEGLLRTIRHEAFHQYLSYALAMMQASPWINEGYAQYFEDEKSADWEMGVLFEPDWETLADFLPALMAMDYGEFYAGTDGERRLKYRLAWSIAYFLENGADKVRFQPFANLKRDYMAALVKSRGDMQYATNAAFGSEERLNLFVLEWKKFWKNR